MIKYRDAMDYKYQLAETYKVKTKIRFNKEISTPDQPVFITLRKDGVLKIKAGYSWDGPSGPTVDTKNFMRGSLVHDALYQLMRSKKLPLKYRKYADSLLRDICREDGMSKLRSWYVYKAVRWFAGKSAELPGKERKIYTAP